MDAEICKVMVFREFQMLHFFHHNSQEPSIFRFSLEMLKILSWWWSDHWHAINAAETRVGAEENKVGIYRQPPLACATDFVYVTLIVVEGGQKSDGEDSHFLKANIEGEFQSQKTIAFIRTRGAPKWREILVWTIKLCFSFSLRLSISLLSTTWLLRSHV